MIIFFKKTNTFWYHAQEVKPKVDAYSYTFLWKKKKVYMQTPFIIIIKKELEKMLFIS